MRYRFIHIASLSFTFAIASATAFAQTRNLQIERDAASVAATENRVALIIGNAAYKESPLFNPVNDASDLAAALEKRGFRVLLRENVGERGLKEAVDQFASYLKRGGVGLFFFAGHGVQVNGQNFLVPVDVGFSSEAEISYKAVAAEYVLSRMAEAGNRVNIVMLDACRDNPFQPARSAKKGLAQMSVGRNEKGTYIAYATSPGSTAADGQGRNGMYTTHLLRSLEESDSDIDKVFGRVRAWVVQDTDGGQVPWTTTSLIDSFYFDPKQALAAMQQPVRPPPPPRMEMVAPSRPFNATEEREFWARIEKSQNAQDYRDYLDKFSSGPNAAFARFRLLRYGGAAATAAPSAPVEIASAAQAPAPAPAPPPAELPSASSNQFAALGPTPLPAPQPDPAAVLSVTPVPAGLQAGTVLKDCPECPELVVIPPGQFVMGMTPGTPGYDPDAGPAHAVRIGAALAVGKFEVTRAQFDAFLRDSGYAVRGGGCNTVRGGRFHLDPRASWRSPGFAQTENDPVVCVSWNDAKAYVGWLARKTGKAYRLLSEAEWEYAARAGTTTAQYWTEGDAGACRYASIADHSVTSVMPGIKSFPCADGYAFTAPAGRFLPNRFGLFDMLGNVWEWAEDCWNVGYNGAPADGSSWTKGACTERVFRGGSWNTSPASVHAGYRDRENSNDRHDNIGFRVARSLP